VNRIAVVLVVIIVAIIGATLFIQNKGKIQNREESSQQAIDTSVTGELNQVIVTDKGFEPSSITIDKNTTVVWRNDSSKQAAVMSNPHPDHTLHKFLNLGEIPQGASVQVKFEESGTYNYHNHFNPDQQGIVVVK
jgi:plastocyanin